MYEQQNNRTGYGNDYQPAPMNQQQYHNQQPNGRDDGFNQQNGQGYQYTQQVGHPSQMPVSHQTHGQGHQQPPVAPEQGKKEKPLWFLQLNTYGKKFGFQFETSETKNGWYTVKIESAERLNPNDPNNKRYNWERKTAIQLTKSELPIFAGVMLGFVDKARFDNHGDTNKFLEVENQGKNFFIRTGGTGLGLHVAPIPTVEAFMYGTMALNEYARNFAGLSTDTAYKIIYELCMRLNHFELIKVPK